ncbi:hypothetical protein [Fructobacillus fructosus]
MNSLRSPLLSALMMVHALYQKQKIQSINHPAGEGLAAFFDNNLYEEI